MTALLTSPAQAAEAEVLQVLLRCWLRETGCAVGGSGPLRVDLPATGHAVPVDVLRTSATGAHVLTSPLPLPQVAALLAAEAAAASGLPVSRGAATAARVLDSAARSVRYATARSAAPDPPACLPGWLAAEQDLVAGHPFHPVAKAREGLSDDEDAQLAPELRGRFPLHWYGARPGTASTSDPATERLLRGLAGEVVPASLVPVPAHPWQAARLTSRPGAAELLAAGDLVDLGPAGPDWWATSSVRTVARPGSPVMLKLSLGLRVTNSTRDNLRAELLLGARTAALVDAGLGRALAAAHPGFGLVRDPGWVGVDGLVGLDTAVREVPPGLLQGEVVCAAALVDARPDRGRPLVTDLVRRLASATGAGTETAALQWFRGYLDAVALPLLWLHGSYGIGLEAHLQNLLVGLDATGRPDRGWYRDNQGWYLAASRLQDAEAMLPAVGAGVPLVFDDALVTERVVYYVGVNALLGVVGSLGGLVDEVDLLRVLAGVLREHLRGPSPSPAAAVLLEADALPVKANLLTSVDGRDELDGPVATQSVYVQVPNPLKEL
jgi:siderophore synthetase component